LTESIRAIGRKRGIPRVTVEFQLRPLPELIVLESSAQHQALPQQDADRGVLAYRVLLDVSE